MIIDAYISFVFQGSQRALQRTERNYLIFKGVTWNRIFTRYSASKKRRPRTR